MGFREIEVEFNFWPIKIKGGFGFLIVSYKNESPKFLTEITFCACPVKILAKIKTKLILEIFFNNKPDLD